MQQQSAMAQAAMRSPAAYSRPALRARGAGAMIFTIFGSIWALIPAVNAGGMLRNVAVTIITVIAAALLAAAFRYLHILRDVVLPESNDEMRKQSRAIGRAFALINLAQYLLFGLIILVANVVGQPRLIMPGIALVVGLHFFPLARLFGTNMDYVIGAILCLFALVVLPFTTMEIGPQHLSLSALVLGIGAAVDLWVGAILRLQTGFQTLHTLASS